MNSSNTENWVIISRILKRIIANISSSTSQTAKSTNLLESCFDSVHIPKVSLHDYLHRINYYAKCSDSCFVLAFIYIDRLLQKNPCFVLKVNNIHRLFLTALVLAIKYNDDVYYDNAVYARIGGVPLAEINFLETSLLSLLKFNLYVSPQLFFEYARELESQHKKIMNREIEEPIVEYEHMSDSLTFSDKPSNKRIEYVDSMASLKTVSSSNEIVQFLRECINSL